jgi:hypothetical protein
MLREEEEKSRFEGLTILMAVSKLPALKECEEILHQRSEYSLLVEIIYICGKSIQI